LNPPFFSDHKTKEREINGLLSAIKTYDLKSGTIITYEEEWNEKIDGINISIIPAWKWSLSS